MKNSTLTRRLIGGYIKPYLKYVAVAVFFMLIGAGMTAAFAKLIQPVLDDVLTAKDQSQLYLIAGMMASAFIIRGIATYIHTVVMSRVGEWIIGDLQKDLFAKFIDLDLAFHQEQTSSGLLSRVMNDVQMVRSAITEALTGLGKSLITLILLAGVMFMQDWVLALISFTIFPLAVSFVLWVGRRLRRISKSMQGQMGDLTARLSQILQGIRLVKAYGQEAYERDRAQYNIDKVRSLKVKVVRVGNLTTPFNEVLVGMVVFGIIVYGGIQVSDGVMTAGQLISFIAAFTLAYEPMKKLAKLNNTYQIGMGAAERVFEMLDQPIIMRTDGTQKLDKAAPQIEFDKVCFEYEEEQGNVLNELSFTADAGKVTAIVGASGAGKSTLFNLLLRFYDVKQGAIKINGTELIDFDIDNLRGNMALVSQDVVIFNETVSENIAYGRAGATQEDIEKAAEMAAADQFVKEMPLGYNTILGEQGTKLSGGQKQRISIARAILRDAPILLLDEATSALDNEAEMLIQKALSRFEKGRTTLVIAHRLSTVQNADKIIVMERGRVTEEGTHDDLLAKKGAYAHMLELLED